MNAAVVTFPGSNCDQDCVRAIELAGGAARLVWHRETSLGDADVVILPGGFAHGDYLRPGAIARFSPVMKAVAAFAHDGGLVAGICNGFQMLCEAGLLPGALLRNRSLRFQSHDCRLRVERTDTPFTSAYAAMGAGDGTAAPSAPRPPALRMPLAHADGAYYADPKTLAEIEEAGQVVFRYCDASGAASAASNPNGSLAEIAGIASRRGNVLGMMPHPDRAVETVLGSEDGLPFFVSLAAHAGRRTREDRNGEERQPTAQARAARPPRLSRSTALADARQQTAQARAPSRTRGGPGSLLHDARPQAPPAPTAPNPSPPSCALLAPSAGGAPADGQDAGGRPHARHALLEASEDGGAPPRPPEPETHAGDGPRNGSRRPRHAPPQPRSGDPRVDEELAAAHGLDSAEYAQIERVLGRTPTFTELGVFSAMWSEHCGYKNSKRLLRLLPTTAPWVVQGPGENAGVVDVGDGLALAFKIESHNHPSAIEPYQGAATGVGGILRDIFTMGARPVATLNSLRFGDLEAGAAAAGGATSLSAKPTGSGPAPPERAADPGEPAAARARYLFAGVVKGIGDYGNCVGVPCIGGEVQFDRGYADNPLVNAMCLGLMKRDDLILGSAQGVGNTLMAVGARTGRDGIHGATFASEELSADQEESSRPQVQVGDPFTEKLLLEASLELIASGCIVGIQDMGAAGLTSSGAEMAGRAGNGVELDVSAVPVREPGMTPYEILLSESQERMLVVARAGEEDAVRAILGKWELEAAVVGRVTGDGAFRVLEDGRVVADVPALPLTEGCPTYEREAEEPAAAKARRSADPALRQSAAPSLEDAFWTVLSSPNVASKRWVHEQYDSTVRAATAEGPGGDAGIVRIPGTNRGIAATVDCNGRFTWLNPRAGAMGAVAEAARNLACAGAAPLAVTNNLNFGSPLKPGVYWQFREAVLGLRDACAFFETPVTGGNVSFYNETDGRPVYPTPVVGMVGLVDDLDAVLRGFFRDEGDRIVLFGRNKGELGGSEYLYRVHGVVEGEPPAVDLPAERALQQALLAMNRRRLLKSAHDVSGGGLAATLAECCLDPAARDRPVGATVRLSSPGLSCVALLFGEDHGRVVASCAPRLLPEVLEAARAHRVPAEKIGSVGGGALRIETPAATLHLPLARLAATYFDAVSHIMDPGEAKA